MQKAQILLFLAVLSLLITTPVVAGAEVIYDSGKLAINTRHVHLSRHTFKTDTVDNGYLTIRKDTPGSTIRTGFLIHNYRFIPLNRFLAGAETTLEKIKLRRINRLSVFLIGSPGASITISAHAETENTPPPAVTFSANPETIEASSSSTLSWSTTNADTASIDQGIGIVEPIGTLAVSPAATTTYTITATGSGGTITSDATVTVTLPAPTVSLSASPLEMTRGESAMLTWSSTNADACEITPAIGSVDTDGSLSVSPAATTTYTITASGPGGTASGQTTVTVFDPPPGVTLAAFPQEIVQGQSSTLSWSTTHADTVSIDQAIGTVQNTGSSVVFPDTDATYTLTATGTGGTTTRSVTVKVVPPISIQILSPQSGESINRPDVMVRGSFSNSNDNQTGITVNGKVAMVYDNQFVVNHLPLEEGTNTITVTATDAENNSIEESITVYAQPTENHISLSADADSGVEPLETTLRLNGPLNYLVPTFTFTGPDTVVFPESLEENEHPARMDRAGIYYFTAQVTDAQGETYTDTLAVVVMSVEALDAVLKANWSDMKAALMSGDIEQALAFHHERYHEKYAAIYNALGDDLPTLVQQMQDISWICYIDGRAKYRIRQNHDINGQVVTITYYLYFSRGENGLWRIERY